MNRFAIVDIETTGTRTPTHGITEVAILLYENGKVSDSFHSLIDPEAPIQPYVSQLTGITNEMVRDAPKFHEVGREIWNLTEDAVFVAHSVNFDYSYIHGAFRDLGAEFRRKKLCTVRFSRRIFPGLPSYSLGNICRHLGITIEDRHRAMGDARATVELFERCLQNDSNGVLDSFLKRTSREATLPPHLPKEVFENLPEKTGVYYFHDRKGRIIYIGKAVNIKNRVYSHFTGRKQKFISSIANVSHKLCGTELIALLLESHEIKHHYPLYNRAQKRDRGRYVLTDYVDRKGIRHLMFTKNHLALQPIISFSSYEAARSFMFGIMEEYRLCPRYCGLQSAHNGCFDYQVKKCKGVCAGRERPSVYNKRVARAIASLDPGARSRLIIDKGREPRERSVIVIENGQYRGFGYFDESRKVESIGEAMQVIAPFKHTADAQRILASSLAGETDSENFL